jgi:hypothetical protein
VNSCSIVNTVETQLKSGRYQVRMSEWTTYNDVNFSDFYPFSAVTWSDNTLKWIMDKSFQATFTNNHLIF